MTASEQGKEKTAAVFFASDLARFVAGQTLIDDGGGFKGF